VPPQHILDSFKLSPDMEIKQIKGMLAEIQKDMKIVKAGSIWKPDGLI